MHINDIRYHYRAYDIALMTEDELWNIPDELHIITFCDGLKRISNKARTIYSAYNWMRVIEFDPTIEILSSFHMGNVYPENGVAASIMSKIAKYYHKRNRHKPRSEYDKEELWRVFYRMNNDAYNAYIVRISKYRTTVSLTNYLKFHNHPLIKEANSKVTNSAASVQHVYSAIDKVLKEPTRDIQLDPVTLMIRSKSAKQEQFNLVVGPVGVKTDCDNYVFPTLVKNSYLMGVTSIKDSLMESRLGSKAYLSQGTPLRTIEFLNKELQCLCCYVTDFSREDCGSEQYVEMLVTKDLLNGIKDRYHMDMETMTLKIVTEEDSHLIGRLIYLRSPIKCADRHEGLVCKTCYGDFEYNVPYDTVLGVLSSTEVIKHAEQATLGAKHHETAAVATRMELDEVTAEFLYEGNETGYLYFKDSYKDKGLKVYVLADKPKDSKLSNGHNIPMVNLANVNIINPSALTRFSDLRVETIDGFSDIPVSSGSRTGYLSSCVLNHIVDYGYDTVTDKRSNYYVIDLDKWDYSEPFVIVPLKRISPLDNVLAIQSFLLSPEKKKGQRSLRLIDMRTIDEAVTTCYRLIRRQLKIDLIHAEIILTAFMRGTRPNDFSIPRLDMPYTFDTYLSLLCGRSIGSLYMVKNQVSVIDDVTSHLDHDRMPSMLDDIIR